MLNGDALKFNSALEPAFAEAPNMDGSGYEKALTRRAGLGHFGANLTYV